MLIGCSMCLQEHMQSQDVDIKSIKTVSLAQEPVAPAPGLGPGTAPAPAPGPAQAAGSSSGGGVDMATLGKGVGAQLTSLLIYTQRRVRLSMHAGAWYLRQAAV